MKLVLATRGSPLALWQAEETRRLIRAVHPQASVELEVVKTTGDRDDRSDLANRDREEVRISVFTAEIDHAVLEGRADVGVHSLKDMTTSLPPGLALAGTLARGPAEDALVAREGRTLSDLPEGSRVATGSTRRIAMLRRARPDLRIVAIRGNVETRLAKLDRGDADALVMALAGLERLGLRDRASEVLGPPPFLPAVGQAIVGIVCRSDDQRTARVLAAITDRESWAEAQAERALLHELHGGCNAPIGARARAVENSISLRVHVLSSDGMERLEGERSGPISDAERIGRELALDLATRGATRLILAARDR